MCVCAFLFRSEFSPIYESINFDATIAAAAATTTNTTINSNNKIGTTTATTAAPNAKNTQPIEPPSPLQRQNAFDSIDGVDRVVKRKQSNERDVRDFLERCIPPPPVTSPPHDTDSDTEFEDLDDPVQISHRTLMKLNSLYSVYKMRRSATTDETNETNEMTDDVVLRLHKFDKCSPRLFRGSSKAMCSLVSVCHCQTNTHVFSHFQCVFSYYVNIIYELMCLMFADDYDNFSHPHPFIFYFFLFPL